MRNGIRFLRALFILPPPPFLHSNDIEDWVLDTMRSTAQAMSEQGDSVSVSRAARGLRPEFPKTFLGDVLRRPFGQELILRDEYDSRILLPHIC